MKRRAIYVLIALCLMAAAAVKGLSEDGNDGVSSEMPSASSSTSSSSSAATSKEEPRAASVISVLAEISPQKEEIMLKRAGYTASYNPQTKQPHWVGWHLTADHVTGPYKRNGIKFHEDEDVPKPRATDADYRSSGYDRGHMCPSGDNKWSQEAQEQSFLFTNICPQLHGLNAGDWNEMEQQCRKWAEKEGEIYIVCGPIFYSSARHKKIGKNKIPVPEAFFKVVLSLKDAPKAIGFIYKNQSGNRPKGDYVNTVDQVERITGIDFFPSLPDDIENKIEAEADIDDWLCNLN